MQVSPLYNDHEYPQRIRNWELAEEAKRKRIQTWKLRKLRELVLSYLVVILFGFILGLMFYGLYLKAN